jgi:hypothetical protein
MIVFVRTVFANLNNWLTTRKWHPSCFIQVAMSWSPWRHSPMVHSRLVEVSTVHTSFYKWTLCFGILHKWAQNVPHPLSSQTNITFFLRPPLWFAPHNALPWACHAPLTWSLYVAFMSTHRFKTISILATFPSRWCLLPFVVLATL